MKNITLKAIRRVSPLGLAGKQPGGDRRLVTTVEFAEHKIGLAVANFARASLTRYISIVHDDGGRVLERSAAFDLVFRIASSPASEVTTEPRNWSIRRRLKSSRTTSDSDSPVGCAMSSLDPMIYGTETYI